MWSSLPALSTAVTWAPGCLATWIANVPVPPPPPLTRTRVPGPAPAVPCSAMAPACGIVDASTKREGRRLVGERRLGRDGILGEAALEAEVVAVHLVARARRGDPGADRRHPAGDVGAEHPPGGPAQAAEAGVGGGADQALPVGEVHRRREHLDEHLLGPGRRHGEVLERGAPRAARSGRTRRPSCGPPPDGGVADSCPSRPRYSRAAAPTCAAQRSSGTWVTRGGWCG